jgi:hypothetical protein
MQPFTLCNIPETVKHHGKTPGGYPHLRHRSLPSPMLQLQHMLAPFSPVRTHQCTTAPLTSRTSTSPTTLPYTTAASHSTALHSTASPSGSNTATGRTTSKPLMGVRRQRETRRSQQSQQNGSSEAEEEASRLLTSHIGACKDVRQMWGLLRASTGLQLSSPASPSRAIDQQQNSSRGSNSRGSSSSSSDSSSNTPLSSSNKRASAKQPRQLAPLLDYHVSAACVRCASLATAVPAPHTPMTNTRSSSSSSGPSSAAAGKRQMLSFLRDLMEVGMVSGRPGGESAYGVCLVFYMCVCVH